MRRWAPPDLARERGIPADVADELRGRYEDDLAILEADDDRDPTALRAQQYRELSRAAIAHKRATVVRMRDDRTIDDTVLRHLQAHLDAEELRLQERPLEG